MSWRDWLGVGAFIIGVMLLCAGAVYWEFYRGRHPGIASMYAEECRAAYGRARTATDSAIVDDRRSASNIAKEPNAPTCGVLRRTGELR